MFDNLKNNLEDLYAVLNEKNCINSDINKTLLLYIFLIIFIIVLFIFYYTH
jgi:hypothetical protein